MGTRRLYLVVFVLVIVCQQAGPAQNNAPATANSAPEKEGLDAKLNIFREALLKNGSLPAATVLLEHEDPNAREILLDVLKQNQNSAARMVVCQALIKSRADRKTVRNAEVFIEPLLGVFDTQVADEARLAAEATRIFDYDLIREPLEKYVTDSTTPVRARVNAMHALKMRRDKRATIKLIELLEDQDKSVASEAATALASIGIVPGANREERQATIEQIKKQTDAVFLGNRLDLLEEQKRTMAAKLEELERDYVALLASAYKNLAEDAAKGKFLAEHLTSSKARVKLWALEEAFQWRKGTRPNFPRGLLEPTLIGSISDPHRDVRLKTADVLAFMVELNSARPLLDQLGVERDEQVKTSLFVALGWACSSAISSNTAANIPDDLKEIRTQTLKWAETFLSDQNSVERAQIGAQVIERLLRRDGLEETEETKHLDLLLSRYNELKGNPGGASSGELLTAMAGLCTQTSACREQAIKRYKPLFIEALRDVSDSVRETAVDGLSNINKAEALAILREGFVNDDSLAVRRKIITLASVVQDPKDLPWLVKKVGVNSESESAWQAMVGIFGGLDAKTVNGWVDSLTAETSTVKLTEDRKIQFLKIAESKAETEKDGDMLRNVRVRLAEVLVQANQLPGAAECWEKLYSTARTRQEKDSAAVQRLGVYLKMSKPELATKLLADVLAEQDLDRESALLKSLDEHLAKPNAGLDPNAVIAQLAAIKPGKERPKWNLWLKEVQSKLSREDKPADKPKSPTG